jgi:hypothetical protein
LVEDQEGVIDELKRKLEAKRPSSG